MFSVANKHVAIIPQIESAIGVENLAEIIAVEGVSAFMVGRKPPLLAAGTHSNYQN